MASAYPFGRNPEFRYLSSSFSRSNMQDSTSSMTTNQPKTKCALKIFLYVCVPLEKQSLKRRDRCRRQTCSHQRCLLSIGVRGRPIYEHSPISGWANPHAHRKICTTLLKTVGRLFVFLFLTQVDW